MSSNGLTIAAMAQESHDNAERQGFHDALLNKIGYRDTALTRLALIHTEVSEATQEVKRHWPMDGSAPAEDMKATYAEELADAIIRIGDAAILAGCTAQDLETAVRLKQFENAGRPYKYGTADVVKE